MVCWMVVRKRKGSGGDVGNEVVVNDGWMVGGILHEEREKTMSEQDLQRACPMMR